MLAVDLFNPLTELHRDDTGPVAARPDNDPRSRLLYNITLVVKHNLNSAQQ